MDLEAEAETFIDGEKGVASVEEALSGARDIYLPFRPKRRTRATAAKEKGLDDADAIQKGLDDKSQEFKESGSEIYVSNDM